MTDITIPDAALDKAAWEIYRKSPKVITYVQAKELARTACLAMLKNWPGMLIKTAVKDMRVYDTAINLPLPPQEGSDGK